MSDLWYAYKRTNIFLKLCEDLEEIGFSFNPYDTCIANQQINGKQHTIRFHVDNLMSSHEDKRSTMSF